VSGGGFAAHTRIEIFLYSTPTMLATATTDTAGAFSARVALPAGVSGAHTLVAGGMGTDQQFRYLNVPVTITGATAGSGGGTGTTGTSTTSTSVSGSSGLAVTGAPVQQIAILGGLILTCGLVLVVTGRRRRA
jgi:hypothetical protein